MDKFKKNIISTLVAGAFFVGIISFSIWGVRSVVRSNSSAGINAISGLIKQSGGYFSKIS